VKLILASASPQRKNLLKQIGLRFEVVESESSEFDILHSNLPPEIRVRKVALSKAENVAKKVKKGLIVGADTVVVYKGKIFGKPKDKIEAKKMLQQLSGTTHKVLTGVALVDAESGRSAVELVSTEVVMKSLLEEEIEFYIATGEPMGKAGAVCIQGKGAQFISKVNGCYYNVIGLPISKFVDMLKEFGYSVW
jgi:septum formation protein